MDLQATQVGLGAVPRTLVRPVEQTSRQKQVFVRKQESLPTPAETQQADQGLTPAEPLPPGTGKAGDVPVSSPDAARDVGYVGTDVVSNASSFTGEESPPSQTSPPPPMELRRGADGRLYGVIQEDSGPNQSESGSPSIDEAVSDASRARSRKRTRAQEAEADQQQAQRQQRRKQTQVTDATGMTTPEKQQVRKLQNRDRQVRLHEAAHAAAAGPYAVGGMTFSYQMGPDGRQYAIGGNVNIDTSPAPSPEETILKMQVIRRAANSPSGPSGADMQVSARAQMTEMQARSEIGEAHFTPLHETIDPSRMPDLLELPGKSGGDSRVHASVNKNLKWHPLPKLKINFDEEELRKSYGVTEKTEPGQHVKREV